MRSRTESCISRSVRIVALVVSASTCAIAGTDVFAFTAEAQASATAGAEVETPQHANEDANRTPTASDIAAGVAVLLKDPDLSGERIIKTLRWKDRRTPQRPELPAWLRWIGGLGRWVDQSARYVVWVAVGLGALTLSVYLARLWNTRTTTTSGDAFVAPTHVGDLDIRPEALPSDIGAAARSLWDRGEHRPALALLYRGLLSRLVHVHRLPIRDSTTEGDCLQLTAERVPGPRHDYATRLVRVWQHAVYGHMPATASIVHRLCEEFAASMNRRPEGVLTSDAQGGPGTEGAQGAAP